MNNYQRQLNDSKDQRNLLKNNKIKGEMGELEANTKPHT
jgi:hypothetical protein